MFILTNEERERLKKEMKEEVLLKYGYHPTDAGLDAVLDSWAAKKGWLIELFKANKDYNGNYQIVFNQSYPRDIEYDDVYIFMDKLYTFAANKAKQEEISYEEWLMNGGNYKYYVFGIFTKSEMLPVYKAVEWFTCYWKPTREMTPHAAETINSICPEMKVHNGQKSSRVIGKLCKMVGFDQDEKYNYLYTRLADSLSPGRIKAKMILSVHPVDYYTMAFGKSWTTCQTIDRGDIHGYALGYHGKSGGGCGSYMEDGSTFIFYTLPVNYNGNTPELEKKVFRNLFHYNGEQIVQGRVYPQDRDGATDLYKEFREIVLEKLFPGTKWNTETGCDICEGATITKGCHYPDYIRFNDCNVSIPDGTTKWKRVEIGSAYHCPSCGKLHERRECIECEDCYDIEREEEE